MPLSSNYRIDRSKYLVKDEFHKLLESAKKNDRDYLLFAVCGNLGLRVGELVSIKVSDIDFEHSVIGIRTLKQKKEKGVIDEMLLPEGINTLISDYIKKYKLKQEDWLFKSDKGVLSKRGCQWIFDKYATKCGLKIKGKDNKKGRGIHCLRHFQGIILSEATNNPTKVAKLLRHRNLDTSLAYAHILDEKEIRKKIGTIL